MISANSIMLYNTQRVFSFSLGSRYSILSFFFLFEQFSQAAYCYVAPFGNCAAALSASVLLYSMLPTKLCLPAASVGRRYAPQRPPCMCCWGKAKWRSNWQLEECIRRCLLNNTMTNEYEYQGLLISNKTKHRRWEKIWWHCFVQFCKWGNLQHSGAMMSRRGIIPSQQNHTLLTHESNTNGAVLFLAPWAVNTFPYGV